jgi:hypothetical protein
MRVFSALLSVSGVSPAQAAKSRPVLRGRLETLAGGLEIRSIQGI